MNSSICGLRQFSVRNTCAYDTRSAVFSQSCSSKDAYASIVEVRKEWESQALLTAEKASDRSLSGKKLGMAKEAAALLIVAYVGFSSAELCLHYLLVSKNVDEVIMSSAPLRLVG